MERREQEKKKGFGEISFLKFERERENFCTHSKDRKRQNIGTIPKVNFSASTNFKIVPYSSVQEHRFQGDLYSSSV